MFPSNSVKWGKTRSCIRELMEYGVKRKKEIGDDKVFDYSLGNPSIEAPIEIKNTIIDLLNNEDSVKLHGYTTAAGNLSTRTVISNNLKKNYGVNVDPGKMYLTCGAAASLTITLHALVCEGDEIILNPPFFPEYSVFVCKSGAKEVRVTPNNDLSLNINDLNNKINNNTKAIIINSPNNPSGAIYSKDNLIELANLLRNKEEEYKHPIYLIVDEPYRELVYEDKYVSPLTLYEDSILCYSYSKSLSLPGERIGYIALNNNLKDSDELYAAINGAGRSLGYVCAPSLWQKVIEKCDGLTSDINKYKENRDLLCSLLDEIGYKYIKPDGAFYIFVEALEKDAKAFSDKAKEFELLLVPSDDFGVNGYVRLAYCIDKNTIINSKQAFKKLYDSYK